MITSFMQIDNILCPTDLSNRSTHALNYAVAFAEQHDSKIHLIHILPGLSISMFTYTRHESGSPLIEGASEWAERKMDEICQYIPQRLFGNRIILKEHDQVSGIINYAKQEHIDLIVIATHRYGPFKRFFYGSVAEQVVRLAPCPVFVTKMGQSDLLTCKLPYPENS